MNSGRTNTGGNKDSQGSARTGTPGNRESRRVDVPPTIHQASSNTGRSARPGNDTGSGMPPNPSHGMGNTRDTDSDSHPSVLGAGSVPPRTTGKFNLQQS